MLAQLKWLRPNSANLLKGISTITSNSCDLVDCIAFVFKYFILLLEKDEQTTKVPFVHNYLFFLFFSFQ